MVITITIMCNPIVLEVFAGSSIKMCSKKQTSADLGALQSSKYNQRWLQCTNDKALYNKLQFRVTGTECTVHSASHTKAAQYLAHVKLWLSKMEQGQITDADLFLPEAATCLFLTGYKGKKERKKLSCMDNLAQAQTNRWVYVATLMANNSLRMQWDTN